MKTTSPHLIGNSIDAVLRQLGLGSTLLRYKILELWPVVVGEQIARVTVAERMDGNKLIVRVSRATWRNELVFLKKELMAKLNAAVNQEIVNDIIFR